MFNLKFKMMKKMYWMMLLICGVLAFPACSDNDNEPGKEPEVPEVPEVPEIPEVVYKQVKQITEVDGDWDDEGNQIDRVVTLKYDANGKLSEAIDEAGFKYAYADTKVTRSKDSYTDPTGSIVYPENLEWMLKSGVAESLKYTSRYNNDEGDEPYYNNCILEYVADGYLSTIKTTSTENDETKDESSETFTFTAGNLTKYTFMEGVRGSEFDEYEYTFTPGEFGNKANIDLFYYLECFESYLTKETFLLNLAGKRSVKLPKEMKVKNTYFYIGDDGETVEEFVYTFNYEADKDGYVTKLTVIEDGEEYAVYKIVYVD